MFLPQINALVRQVFAKKSNLNIFIRLDFQPVGAKSNCQTTTTKNTFVEFFVCRTDLKVQDGNSECFRRRIDFYQGKKRTGAAQL